MNLKQLLKKKKISIYKLAQLSKVPYATCNDIVNGKTKIEKCTVETVYKLARALDVSMESLLNPKFINRSNFENFKSMICHQLKEMGDINFVINTLKSDDISMYFERKWYPECLYLLGMLDYISNENDIPICNEYDEIRKCKLEKPIYPSGVIAVALANKDDDELKKAEDSAIPEFKRFNIIENEVRNVI